MTKAWTSVIICVCFVLLLRKDMNTWSGTKPSERNCCLSDVNNHSFILIILCVIFFSVLGLGYVQENCTTADQEKAHLVIFSKLQEETNQNPVAPLVRINFPFDSSYLNIKLNKTVDLWNKLVLPALRVKPKKTPTPAPHPLLPPVVTPPPLHVWWLLVMDDRWTEGLFPGCALNFHVAHTDILQGWEVHTHTHTHTYTHSHTWPTFTRIETHTLYLTLSLDRKSLHSLHWPTSALHNSEETEAFDRQMSVN